MRIPPVVVSMFAILFASVSSAGVVMQFEEKSPGATAGTQGTAWIEADRLRVDSGKESVIFRGDKQLLWAWSAGDKSYVELTKAQAREMGAAMGELQKQMASMSPEERKMVEQVMSSQMGSLSSRVESNAAASAAPVTFKALGKTDTINGWATTAYEGQRAGKSEGEYWVTDWKAFGVTASDFDAFGKLAAFIKEVAGPFASKIDATYAQKYGEGGLPGVPVRTITKNDAGTQVHEIKKLGHEDIAASIFEVPAGLAKQQMDSPRSR